MLKSRCSRALPAVLCWLAVLGVALPGISHAGGGGCSGNGCAKTMICTAVSATPGTSVFPPPTVPSTFTVQVNLDSYSEMGALQIKSATVQEADWTMIQAQGTMGSLGNATVTLDTAAGRSFYRMTSQSSQGAPFFPVTAECHLFWRFQATNPQTGTTEILHSTEAVYVATGITSYPPTAGTVFQLQNAVTVRSESERIACTVQPGTATVAYSGEAVNPAVVINELDTDDGAGGGSSFIELYDGGLGDRPLDHMTLVLFDGGSERSYAEAIPLTGLRSRPDGFFLIGGPDVKGADLTLDLQLQSENAAMALYYSKTTDFSAGFEATADEEMDAVVLGPVAAGSALRKLVRPGMPVLTERAEGNSARHSLQRARDGGWRRDTRSYVAARPSPGRANRTAPVPVRKASHANLLLGAPLGLGLVWLWKRRG